MKSSELIRNLTRNGWYKVRQKGSHVIMQHPEKEGQIVVPQHGNQEVGKGLANKILKQAGIKS
ncbi:MAG: type II toxin-antitoxin system HicA family toxin [Chitinophagales bacterium]|nr:type II toxin-antitoxin system HicA family toxin [Chitinophagaceae bacterium]MBP9883274.1 type II toxin-antitoxin system HicA family toxin [Chitinophagales bacterium]